MSRHNLFKKLDAVFIGGDVQRWHNRRYMQAQSVAHHSWRVAQIATYLYDSSVLDIPSNVLLAALDHDVAEAWTGDISAPVKSAAPNIRDHVELLATDWLLSKGLREDYALTDTEKLFIHLCDKLEAMHYCCDMLAQGNPGGTVPFWVVNSVVEGILLSDHAQGAEWLDRAQGLVQDLQYHWSHFLHGESPLS